MTRIRKIRFHRFGDNEVPQLDEIEQSGPDARQILVTVRRQRELGRLQDPLRQISFGER